MNTIAEQGTIAPEVQEFLAAVRGQLADLDPEEQREILDGLEADLTDLVAERGGEALGDPTAYARELRAATGFEPETVRDLTGSRRSAGETVDGLLDAARHRFDAVLARVPGDAPALLSWLRPLWWVLRGWAAVQLLDMYDGRVRANAVPDLHGLGWLLCIAAIAASVAVGRGVIWPGGSGRGAGARMVLLGLNLLAAVVTLLAVSQVADRIDHRYDRGYARGFENGLQIGTDDADNNRAGVYVDGNWVSNIYPYDAQGRPLVGVQLFDQIGNPIDVVLQPEYDEGVSCISEDSECVSQDVPMDEFGNQLPRVFYPWTNGVTPLLNVFPVPSRVQEGEEPSPTAFTEAVKPTIGPLPLMSVPKVSLPGIDTGIHRGGQSVGDG
jgi:hypothetical protein